MPYLSVTYPCLIVVKKVRKLAGTYIKDWNSEHKNMIEFSPETKKKGNGGVFNICIEIVHILSHSSNKEDFYPGNHQLLIFLQYRFFCICHVLRIQENRELVENY